jgi:hypothetical protein
MSSKEGCGQLSTWWRSHTHSIQRGISKTQFSSRNNATACSFAAFNTAGIEPLLDLLVCQLHTGILLVIGCFKLNSQPLSLAVPNQYKSAQARIEHKVGVSAYQANPSGLKLRYLVAQSAVNNALRMDDDLELVVVKPKRK